MLALALFSGGLDSLLSMRLLRDQGFEVLALHFDIGFGGNSDKSEYFKNATAQIGARLEVVDIKSQFFSEVLFAPKYGYGKHFNPCIDCHANMFKWAFKKLVEYGAVCVISGEVVGQRPKSQRKEALDLVRKIVREFGADAMFDGILSRDGSDSNKPQFLDDLLLRPMSAKLLEPSFVERVGIVNRDLLLDVSGRGRSRQLELAKHYGFKYFEKPGGGCLLTIDSVTDKIKDTLSTRAPVLDDLALFKVGRYMILPDGARFILGRNESDNEKLNFTHAEMDSVLLLDVIGGRGFISKDASDADKLLAAQIALAYAKTAPESGLDSTYSVQIGDLVLDSVTPCEKSYAQQFLITH